MDQRHAWRPRRRTSLALLAGSLLLLPGAGVRARADLIAPPELAQELPGAHWRGGGSMRFMGVQLYEARLWAPTPVQGDPAQTALALELVYARTIKADLIVSSALREMQRVGSVTPEQATRWTQAMAALFPDIQPGDRLTGVQRPGQSARFFFNGKLRGEVADADFTRLFFGIWLSPRTAEPQLRAQLLGQAP